MECVNGKTPHQAWMSEGIIADALPMQRRRMMLNFMEVLAAIHEVDWHSKSLSFLMNRASGNKAVEREVNWYWDALAWKDEKVEIERLLPIRNWLIANEPPASRLSLCHGDANLTNNLFRDASIVSVVDWEMAFIGPPECDIAYAELTLTSMTENFPEGFPALSELRAHYEKVSGRTLQHMDYYWLFALFRGSIILFLSRSAYPADFLPIFDEHLRPIIAKLDQVARTIGV
jgi:aminoglycoside phosphotransferase (APT) family kinase protein